VDLNFL
jgi:hypothetical protein